MVKNNCFFSSKNNIFLLDQRYSIYIHVVTFGTELERLWLAECVSECVCPVMTRWADLSCWPDPGLNTSSRTRDLHHHSSVDWPLSFPVEKEPRLFRTVSAVNSRSRKSSDWTSSALWLMSHSYCIDFFFSWSWSTDLLTKYKSCKQSPQMCRWLSTKLAAFKQPFSEESSWVSKFPSNNTIRMCGALSSAVCTSPSQSGPKVPDDASSDPATSISSEDVAEHLRVTLLLHLNKHFLLSLLRKSSILLVVAVALILFFFFFCNQTQLWGLI